MNLLMKLLMLLCLLISKAYASPLLIGYYSNWAQFRPEPADFHPHNLIPIIHRLTDIHYAYLFFNYDTQTRFPTNDWKIQFTVDNDKKMLTHVVDLAKPKPVYVSVGGWDFNDPTHPYGVTTFPFFSELVADANKYNPFIQSCIDLCQKFHLAGVCLEWEFPGVPNRGGNTNDYQNLSTFLNIFKTQMTAKGFKIRMAVPGMAPPGYVDGFAFINSNAYSISTNNAQTYIDWVSALSQYVDLFYIMCYDYFGPEWQPNNGKDALPLTGENAPLNPNPKVPEVVNNPTCVKQTLHAYTNNSQHMGDSTPRNKIVIGVPAYGRTFRGLRFPGDLHKQPFGPGAEFTEPDTGGHYTQLVGFQSYYEIKYNLLNNYYTHTRTNPVTHTAYAWGEKNKLWVSFDNGKTADKKGKFVVKQKLRGSGVFTLDDDDFFDKHPFVITNHVADGLGLPH